MSRTVAIYIDQGGLDCRVILDGVDITTVCYGIEVRAFVAQPTTVTLHLRANVELTGEPGSIIVAPRPPAPPPGHDA